MTALYVARSGDLAYRIPEPRNFGFAFARSVDPGGDRLITAVLLRGGVVYLMRDSATQPGRYELDGATKGSATGGASSVSNGPTGVPLAVFLSEMNMRWRAWASSWIADLTNAGSAAYGGPVWTNAGEALSTLQVAATAWGWEPL